MSIVDLIKKREIRKDSRANPANVANDERLSTTPLATLATLALASTADERVFNLGKTGAGDAATTYYWWRFHYADDHSKEASYCPPVTHAEALAGEPDAITAQPFKPLPRQPKEPLSEKDEASIRVWLTRINETDDEIAAVLHQCRCDEGARTSFISLAQPIDNQEAAS